jgi:hypothetical protein
VIEHFNLCDKDFFVIYTNKGAKLYTEIKGKKINRIKQKPVLEMTFIYNPKEGKLEVGILNYRAKLLDFTGLFGKHILQDDINTSNLKKVYDLGKIKRSINRIGDFKFVNTKEIQVHIADLYYNTSDNFFGSIGGNKRNQGTFLNKVQKDKFLANAELVKIRMIAKYKEETENKTRAFTIEGNKCNLSHDKTDVKIRNILKNSGLEAMTHLEIIQAFKEYLIKGKVVNLYNISKIQGNPQPFSYLIAKGFLTQVNDISYNLYCEECLKVCNMEEMGEILTCGCGSNLFKEHLTDIEDYILNFEEIKEMLISHLKITKDDNIEDDTYFAFHNYGNTGKVNLHLAKEEIEIEKLKQDIAKEKIIISVYGMAEEKLENCLVIPLYNLLESNNIKFCKTKFAEAVRVFVTEVKKSKTENTKQLLNEKIEYAKSINNEKLTCEQLFDIYSKRYGGSLRTFKSHIWINIKT